MKNNNNNNNTLANALSNKLMQSRKTESRNSTKKWFYNYAMQATKVLAKKMSAEYELNKPIMLFHTETKGNYVMRTETMFHIDDTTRTVESTESTYKLYVNMAALYDDYCDIGGEDNIHGELALAIIKAAMRHEVRHMLQAENHYYDGVAEGVVVDPYSQWAVYGDIPWEADANLFAKTEAESDLERLCAHRLLLSQRVDVNKYEREERTVKEMKRVSNAAMRRVRKNMDLARDSKETGIVPAVKYAGKMVGHVINKDMNAILNEDYTEVVVRKLFRLTGTKHGVKRVRKDLQSPVMTPGYYTTDQFLAMQAPKFRQLADEVGKEVGRNVIIHYNPTRMMLQGTICASTLLEEPCGFTIIIVDDSFDKLSEPSKKAIVYHEIGHHVHGHEAYSLFDLQRNKAMEIEADSYAAMHVGREAVKRALLEMRLNARMNPLSKLPYRSLVKSQGFNKRIDIL